jgi:MFS family permease
MQTGGGAARFDELRRNWRILPPSLAGITLCSVHGYSLGVMIVPLEREFGWPRAEISGGLFIIALIALIAAPLTGLATDRLGPRRIALAGVLAFCGCLALLSTATASVVSWWLLWAVLGLGNMLILPTVWTKAINSRFDANRGIALALALCGTGIAAAFVPSLTNLLIEGFGWRQAYIGLGLIGALAVFPLVWWLFRPAERTVDAASHDTLQAGGVASSGVSIRRGLTMPSFLKLAGAIWLFSIALCALTTNAVPVLLARGMTAATAAGLAGLIGIGSITGRLVGGLLLDRFDAAKVAAVSVLMPVVSVLLLLGFPGSEVAAALACLVIGLSVGTEVDCAAYLAARHFGMRSFGTLFGTLNGLMLFGNGIAPVVANHVYDVTKSYEMVLWFQIPACVGTALLFLLLGPYPRFEDEADGIVEQPKTRHAPA